MTQSIQPGGAVGPVLAFTLALAMVVPGTAWAGEQVSINVVGEADEGADDARQRALDAAFASAVGRALGDELTRSQRSRHAKALRENVSRRARLYVTSYKVRDSSSIEGKLRLEVTVEIDVAKLRRKLTDLGVDADRNTSAPANGARPAMLLLLHATVDGKTSVSFGGGGDGGTVGRLFAKELGEHGFDTTPAVGDVPVSSDTRSRLPVEDGAAAALVTKLGVGGAFIVGVKTEPEGRVRGTRNAGARARVEIRVVDSKGALIARASTERAAWGTSRRAAAAGAARAAVTYAVGSIVGRVAEHWPDDDVSGEGMLVVIRGATRWASVLAIKRRLNGARLRRFSRGRISLQIPRGHSAAAIARIIGGTQLPSGSMSAEARGKSRVDVNVRDAASVEQ